MKTTKTNEPRTVELPFHGIIRGLLNLAARNPHGADMDAFIFWAALKPDKQIEERLLLDDLRGALVETGMSEGAAKAYTFHAWRHFFTAYMRPRIFTRRASRNTTGYIGSSGRLLHSAATQLPIPVPLLRP
jgi:hypothetical protein